jgi:hypothetical protein
VRVQVVAASGVVLGVLTVALIFFGVFPSPLLHLIERAVATLP